MDFTNRPSKDERAEALYWVIVGYINKHRRAPTQRQLCALTGMSTYEVGNRVFWLRGRGMIAEDSTMPVEQVATSA